MSRMHSSEVEGNQDEKGSGSAEESASLGSEKRAEENKPQAPISIDPVSQLLVAKDNAELMRMITIFMKGQSFPKSMDTPAKCITAWNLAASFKNVSPQRAMSRMMYVNDQLGIWGELPKALAEETKELEDFEIFVVDREYNKIISDNKNLHVDPYAAICRIKRKGRNKNEYFFTIDEAEKAGLINKRGPWQQYAKIMLSWRAQGQALKFEFADALMGADIIEYRFNEFPELKDVTPSREEKVKDLNDKFSKKEVVDVDQSSAH